MSEPARAAFLEKASKGAVLMSAVAALAFATNIGARGWPLLQWLVIGAFALGLILGRLRPVTGWWIALGTMYLGSPILIATHGRTLFWDDTIWFAGLLGLAMTAGGFRWSIPRPWRWPAALWALSVALVWPVIVIRELDGSAELLTKVHIGLGVLGGQPSIVTGWIAIVALVSMLGLLCLDGICRRFHTEGRPAFVRTFVWPMAFSIVLSSVLALYQGLVDANFWSGHNWGEIGRAAGGLGDGNPYGAIAGVWVGGFAVLAAYATTRAGKIAAFAGALVCWGGLWMTGSRMALLAGLICTGFALFAMFRPTLARSKRGVVLAVVIGAAAISVIVYLAGRAGIDDPLTRLMAKMPPLTPAGLKWFVTSELWNRNGVPFGSSFVEIMRHFPLAGIGVGSWQHIYPDYAFMLTGTRFFFDNAQSWPRHQLAELGVIGSVGWILFAFHFVRALYGAGRRQSELSGVALKGALTAFIVVSLASMPSQHPMVALSFWFFVAWFFIEAELLPGRVSGTPVAPTTRSWTFAWGIATIFVALTAYQAVTLLRPPLRAARANWNFQYGFYDIERPAGQLAFRWTTGRAVDVFEVPAEYRHGYVKVVIGGGAPDLGIHPVRIVLRRGGSVIASADDYDGASRTLYVAVRGERSLMLQIDLSRTWRPDHFGVSTDDRDLGVRVDEWLFVNEPPAGAIVVK